MPPPASSLAVRFRQRLEGWMRRLPLGTGTHPRTLRDEALARRVSAAVEKSVQRGRFAGVQFYVFEGEVALIGTVALQRDADALARQVQAVRGVLGVVSHLQVVEGILGTGRPPPGAAT